MIRPVQRRAALLGRRRAAGPPPSPPSPPTPLRFAATNARFAGGSSTANTTTMLTQRSKHIAGGALSELVIGLMAWRVVATTEGEMPNPWFVDKLAVEIGSTVVPVTFSGARTAIVSPGMAVLLSDPVPASAFGMTAIPRDTLMGVRLAAHVAASTDVFPTAADGGAVSFVNASATETGGFAGYHAYRHTPANYIDQVDATGPMTTPPGASLNTSSMPLMVLGRFAAGNTTKAVFALGDSITGGTGDLYGASMPSAAGSGYAMRACLDSNGGGAIPLFNAGRLAYPLAAWNAAHPSGPGGRTDTYRKALMPMPTWSPPRSASTISAT